MKAWEYVVNDAQRFRAQAELCLRIARLMKDRAAADQLNAKAADYLAQAVELEHFSIRLGVSRVREISVAFFFGNTFEKRGDCSPKLLNCARLHLA